MERKSASTVCALLGVMCLNSLRHVIQCKVHANFGWQRAPGPKAPRLPIDLRTLLLSCCEVYIQWFGCQLHARILHLLLDDVFLVALVLPVFLSVVAHAFAVARIGYYASLLFAHGGYASRALSSLVWLRELENRPAETV